MNWIPKDEKPSDWYCTDLVISSFITQVLKVYISSGQKSVQVDTSATQRLEDVQELLDFNKEVQLEYLGTGWVDGEICGSIAFTCKCSDLSDLLLFEVRLKPSATESLSVLIVIMVHLSIPLITTRVLAWVGVFESVEVPQDGKRTYSLPNPW